VATVTPCSSVMHSKIQRLALTLLVLGICANNTHHAFASDYLALFTHFLNGRTDFHGFSTISIYSDK
jgi:hypothetical protein